jgi:hypothetical protein
MKNDSLIENLKKRKKFLLRKFNNSLFFLIEIKNFLTGSESIIEKRHVFFIFGLITTLILYIVLALVL